MSELVVLPVPGIGTLAMSREHFEQAISAGRQFELHPVAVLPPERKLVDAAQLEAVTGVPQTWWMAQARERRIPCHKIGRRVRFDYDEVISSDAFKRREVP